MSDTSKSGGFGRFGGKTAPEDDEGVETEETDEETSEATEESPSSGSAQTETCNECGRQQEVVFPADHFDVARQFRCQSCGAVNVARFPDNAQSGVEGDIQAAQFEQAILADEEQARRVSGDEAVDKALEARKAREQANADAGSTDTTEETVEEDEAE